MTEINNMSDIKSIKMIINSARTDFRAQLTFGGEAVLPKADLLSLIATIESQKEEIERWKVNSTEFEKVLNRQIESLKAITELAVKGLKELQHYTAPDYPFKNAETIAEFHTLIGLTLSEIARLSQ